MSDSSREISPAPQSTTRLDESQPSTTPGDASTIATSAAEPAQEPSQDRLARFKALQARAKKSTEYNLKEAAAESQRLSTDPSQLTSLARKHAVASHKLLKADTEAAGEDFERKRAWDWTVEESEKWDKRMAKKQRNREGVFFTDYQQEANKVYKWQIKNMDIDSEAYKLAKDDAMRKAAESGNLEVIETGDGELVAVDAEGNTFSSAANVGFVMKPEKAAIDRLVDNLKKAEDVRMKKRRDRAGKGEDGDVTYINDKNKQFNQKLARFYDKYTTEIRENFERGTAI